LLKGTSSKVNESNLDQRFKLWQERIILGFQKAIPEVAFVVLECRQMVGLFQCIVHRPNINPTETSVSMVKTGLGGYHGNKVIVINGRVPLLLVLY
jgi:hypothetical protein